MDRMSNAILIILTLSLSLAATSSLLGRAEAQSSSLMHFISLTASATLVVPGQTVGFNATLQGSPVEGLYGPIYSVYVLANDSAVMRQFVNLPFTNNTMTTSVLLDWNTTGLAAGIYNITGLLTACPRTILCNASDKYTNSFNDGTVTLASPAIFFTQTTTFEDVTGSITGNLTMSQTSHILFGLVFVNAVNDTTQTTFFSKTFSIYFDFTGDTIRFGFSIPTSPLMLGYSCTVIASSGSFQGCSLTKDPDVNHNGRVDILDLATLAIAYGSSAGSPLYNPAVDIEGLGKINIIDAATMAYFFDELVF